MENESRGGIDKPVRMGNHPFVAGRVDWQQLLGLLALPVHSRQGATAACLTSPRVTFTAT
jgi:hypothetical protein